MRLAIALVLALAIGVPACAGAACSTPVKPDWTSRRPHPPKPYGVTLFRSKLLRQDVVLLWFATSEFGDAQRVAGEACDFGTKRYAAQIDKSPATIVLVEAVPSQTYDDRVEAFAFTRARASRLWRRVTDRTVVRDLVSTVM
jgi:hypothetical protein